MIIEKGKANWVRRRQIRRASAVNPTNNKSGEMSMKEHMVAAKM
jgi:hypothetical protein